MKRYIYPILMAALGAIVFLIRSKDGKIAELKKQLLLKKHEDEFRKAKEEVANAKQKSEDLDKRARAAELAYRDARRRYEQPK